MSDAYEAALKIMALVDEFPSEPFSYERKQVELKIEELIAQHAQQVDNELDYSFNLGYEEGCIDTRDELRDEYESRIEELEDEIEQLKSDNEQKDQDAFTDGYETARLEYGPK